MILFSEWMILETRKFDAKTIKSLAKKIKVNISNYDIKELIAGMRTEQEHMSDKKLDVIKGDDSKILKIALAHLKEDPHYYKKLQKAKL